MSLVRVDERHTFGTGVSLQWKLRNYSEEEEEDENGPEAPSDDSLTSASPWLANGPTEASWEVGLLEGGTGITGNWWR